MKKKALILFALIMLVMFSSCSKKTEPETDAVISVNGEIVTQAEVDYFKGKLKAELINDYIEKYSVEYTSDFWQTEFDGKTPEDALEEKALEEGIMAKIQFVLMKEEGIFEDITYEGLYKKAEDFNKANAGKAGVVGLKSIKMSQFYTYYLQTGVMELKNIYAEDKLKPTDSEIEKKINEIEKQNDGDILQQDYENLAKDKLKTEKYEAFITEIRKNAEIKEVV